MIEQGNGPEPPEEKKEKDKKRKRSNFFLSWLAARENTPATDTPEAQEGEIPKERFKFFRNLFRRHVLTEPVDSPAEMVAGQDNKEEVEDRWPRFEPYVETREEPEPVLPATENALAATGSVETSSSHKPDAPTAAEPEFKTYPLPLPEDLEERLRPLRDAETAPADTALNQQASRPTEILKPEPETVVNRREPLAAATLLGLGAEYLGRKRQGREQGKKIEKLERKAADTERRADKLETEVPRQAVVELRNSQQTERQVRSEPSRLMEKVRLERKPDKKEIRPAKQKERLAEEVAKKIERYEKEQEAPAVVLKEMVKAAEAGAPVERIYERRQEVRDEAGSNYGYGAAVPVSAVLKDMSGSSSVPIGLTAGSFSNGPSDSSPADGRLYKEAAQRGFWGAIVIVIFMLMVYLFA